MSEELIKRARILVVSPDIAPPSVLINTIRGLLSIHESQQSQIKQLREALKNILEPLEAFIGEHCHNIPITPGDEHSDSISVCDDCGIIMDEHGYDTGCETGWILEALHIAQQAIKDIKEEIGDEHRVAKK